MAAQNGHTDCVKLLLQEEKVDVNRQRENGWTALMIAADNGKWSMD